MNCVLIASPECYVESKLKEGKNREKLEGCCDKPGEKLW